MRRWVRDISSLPSWAVRTVEARARRSRLSRLATKRNRNARPRRQRRSKPIPTSIFRLWLHAAVQAPRSPRKRNEPSRSLPALAADNRGTAITRRGFSNAWSTSASANSLKHQANQKGEAAARETGRRLLFCGSNCRSRFTSCVRRTSVPPESWRVGCVIHCSLAWRCRLSLFLPAHRRPSRRLRLPLRRVPRMRD